MAFIRKKTYIGAGAAACMLSLACACPAFAATVDDLTATYQLATTAYQKTLVEKEKNAEQITAVESEIEEANRELASSKENLSDSAVSMYKHQRNRSDVLGMVLESESLTDAITNLDRYMRIERYWADTVQSVKQERADLGEKKVELEDERDRISEKLVKSQKEAEAAKAALRDADHSDGAFYHQKQGNGSNCGATSFIVGVNILLHKNIYRDNVAVWNGPGFEGDSTQSLSFKGSTWLMASGLSDTIVCKSVTGDIHYADQLKAELEQGRVVVISSGAGSIWQRADGTSAGLGTFPDGHWIVFYYYKDGLFYANDSSVDAKRGAGCVYTTQQMQQWLNGRENHFATVLAKKSLGTDDIDYKALDSAWQSIPTSSTFEDIVEGESSEEDASKEKSSSADKAKSSSAAAKVKDKSADAAQKSAKEKAPKKSKGDDANKAADKADKAAGNAEVAVDDTAASEPADDAAAENVDASEVEGAEESAGQGDAEDSSADKSKEKKKDKKGDAEDEER